MNGYALVRARYPNKVMSPYVYNKETNLSKIQAMIMELKLRKKKMKEIMTKASNLPKMRLMGLASMTNKMRKS
jgi:hypothetical protein